MVQLDAFQLKWHKFVSTETIYITPSNWQYGHVMQHPPIFRAIVSWSNSCEQQCWFDQNFSCRKSWISNRKKRNHPLWFWQKRKKVMHDKQSMHLILSSGSSIRFRCVWTELSKKRSDPNGRHYWRPGRKGSYERGSDLWLHARAVGSIERTPLPCL